MASHEEIVSSCCLCKGDMAGMAATLYVPTPLRKLTHGQSKVQIMATSVAEVIDRADADYPGFRDRVLDTDGEIKRFINVFVNGVDVRSLQGKATRIKEGDEVSVIPAMAGGEADSERRVLENPNGFKF